jgi:hypothetical protein
MEFLDEKHHHYRSYNNHRLDLGEILEDVEKQDNEEVLEVETRTCGCEYDENGPEIKLVSAVH